MYGCSLVGGNLRSVEDLPRLNQSPLVSLDVVAEASNDADDGKSLDGHLLPHVMFRTGSPGQEGANILSQLRLSSRGAVIILDDLIVDGSTHADGSSREVWVEVLSLPQLYTSWWVTVAIEEMVDIVLSTVSGKHNV